MLTQNTKPKSVIATKQSTSTLIATYVLAVIVMGCVSLVFGLIAVKWAVQDTVRFPQRDGLAPGTRVEFIKFEDNPADFGN